MCTSSWEPAAPRLRLLQMNTRRLETWLASGFFRYKSPWNTSHVIFRVRTGDLWSGVGSERGNSECFSVTAEGDMISTT